MTILNIIDTLEAASSRLEKESILKQHQNHTLWTNILKVTYDPFLNFYIKKIPEYDTSEESISLEEALDSFLKTIPTRELTGNAAIEFTSGLLSKLSSYDDQEVFKRIIDRDLKCGINVSTINKIYKNLIPTFDVALSHKDISGIKFPAFAQTKMDGSRVHIAVNYNEANIYTRNGKTLHSYVIEAMDSDLSQVARNGETWDGEIVFFKDGKPLDRKTSNGLFNKAVKGTISKEEAKMVKFICWDIIDRTSTIPYIDRYKTMIERFTKIYDSIEMVETAYVENEEQAYDFYNKQIETGEEGAILKNLDFKWEGKRVKGMGKMKQIEESDLVVVGWEEGTGKNTGKLGALVCETSDGLLRVNVGTGFSDEQRDSITESIIGSIITVQYNQIIDSKNKETKSLFLPRFIEIRTDKNVANSINELK